MGRVSLVRLLSALCLVLAAHGLWAATLRSGNLQAEASQLLNHFGCIGRDSGSHSCPGLPKAYPEQVEIAQAVTWEGITGGNLSQAIIAAPSGGLVANGAFSDGIPLAVQLWVHNAAGPVTVRDSAGYNRGWCRERDHGSAFC
jgi:hypothetical protein